MISDFQEQLAAFSKKHKIKTNVNLEELNLEYPPDAPTTPYNFVELNDVVLRPPLAKYLKNISTDDPVKMQAGFKEFIKDNSVKKYSGYFDVTIKNLTPLYIGGTNNTFFSDGENVCIPGSSLRGCIKNIFKIITNSSMRAGDNPDITDKHLYFRTFAVKYKPSRDLYTKHMTRTLIDPKTNKPVLNKKGKPVVKSVAKAGFLVRKGKNYFICPADFRARRLVDLKLNAVKETQRGKSSTCEWNDTFVNVFSGKMQRKEHYYEFKHPDWNTTLSISDDVISDYRNDKNRDNNKGRDVFDKKSTPKANYTILKGSEAYDFISPCFYVDKDNTVLHFGANPYYRIPYHQSIADHIPKKLKSPEVDFTDAIFGNKECWSSRVFFEDSYLQGNAQFFAKDYVIPLMTPNPTSFQFYLTPKDGTAMHWESNALIRGYKMYWHKKMSWSGKKEDYGENEKIIRQIAPLKENHIFKGKIRFQNLDITELGALTAVLNLYEHNNSHFKIGMGKPIGMGTIELKAKLYLQDKNYYTNLFDDKGFYDNHKEEDKTKFAQDFIDYLEANIPKKSLINYQKKLKTLYKLMSIDYMEENNEKINELTKYMRFNDTDVKEKLSQRKPLPDAKTVIHKFNSPD